jgi:hypothetical protein
MLDMISQRILRSFIEFDHEALDLHTLFEAGGNDPDHRLAVLDAVGELVSGGYLEERGNDFYSLTEAGRRAAGGFGGIITRRPGEG